MGSGVPVSLFAATIRSFWSGDSILYSLTFAVQKGDESIDHEATLRWNPATGQVSVISDKVVQ